VFGPLILNTTPEIAKLSEPNLNPNPRVFRHNSNFRQSSGRFSAAIELSIYDTQSCTSVCTCNVAICETKQVTHLCCKCNTFAATILQLALILAHICNSEVSD